MWYHSSWFFYTVFVTIVLILVLYDLGVFRLRKKAQKPQSRLRRSIKQTFIWILLGSLFSIYIYHERGSQTSIAYIAAFFMEWSLSIDNVFVFIVLFKGFRVQESHSERVLLIGIILAIIFRMLFITLGIAVVEKFQWLFYFFAIFLVYTGVRIYSAKVKEIDNYKPSPFTKWVYKVLHIQDDTSGKFFIKKNKNWLPTSLFLLVIVIAFTDIVFALDSIPAVLAITQDELAVYTSNIFAVMGLRSLYFTLQGSANKFIYLSKGIGIVLIFIGIKIVLSEYSNYHLSALLSLCIIMGCLLFSILLSICKTRRA